MASGSAARRIDWFFHVEGAERLLPVAQRMAIDDERWSAMIERVDAGVGLYVFLTSGIVRQDFTLELQHEEEEPWLVSDTAVTGRVSLSLSDGCGAEISRDQCVLFRPNDRCARFALLSGQIFRVAGFMVRADRVLRMFGDQVPDVIQPMIERGTPTSPLVALRASADIRKLAQSLFSDQLAGALRLVFLEGVALQLLALQTAAQGNAKRGNASTTISSTRRRLIKEAHDGLLADMSNPPSLGALAAATGMSDKALNAGFREVYGTTVFGVLRDERLEHARLALETGALSVKTIAFRVGYSHVSNFTKAFTSRFGLPPRRYIRRKEC